MPVVAIVLVLLAGVFAGVRIERAHPPPLPAVINPSANAHQMLASTLDARVARLVLDRIPVNRSAYPKIVALTFDDGPYPVSTPLLLDLLHDLHVKATFFLIGNDAALFPELAGRIEREGHEIANHTLTHPMRFDLLAPDQVRDELLQGANVLERYAHDPAIRTMMRPPHGRFTERTVEAAQQAGYHVILWNEDPGDWRTVAPKVLARDVELHATAPDILLLHSGSMETIDMLPEVIARFRSAGYDFATVGELLRRVPENEILHPYRHSV